MIQWTRCSWVLIVPLLCVGCGGGGPSTIDNGLDNATLRRAPIKVDADGNARVLIGFKSTPNLEEEGLIEAHGGKLKARYHIVPAIAATLPQQALAALKKNPHVAYVEGDVQGRLLIDEVPWGIQRVGAPTVQGLGVKGAGVKVAVIDTGIDYNHTDLKANYGGGTDIADNDSDPKDWHGHGTHCAGIIGADDNGVGVVGVAPDVQLFALKVFSDGSTSCWWSDVIQALQWCVDHQIQIASMSIGGDYSSTFEQACNNALQQGVLLVAAAGNSGGPVKYPAGFDSVIAVGATDSNNVRASWSCYGNNLELMAPGVSIKSTVLNNTYGLKSGTSMACPHVSGSAALVWSAYPTWAAAQVRQQLTSTAQDLGTAGKDPYYGYGLVRADNAVSVTPPPPSPPPSLSKVEVTPASASIVKGATQQFIAKAVYSDGSSQNVTSQAAWSSSNTSVATVNASGVATGVNAGSAAIVATYQEVSGNAALTVTEPLLSKVEVTPASASIVKGSIQQFKAKAVYNDGSSQDVTNEATWSSTSNSSAAVATIDPYGVATGINAGTATITATYQGISGNATLTVTEPSGDVVEITRAEYILKRGHLRVFATSSGAPTAVLQVYNADGTYCYGKLAYAGGNIYVISLVKVQDPGGWVKVVSSLGGSATAAVVYK